MNMQTKAINIRFRFEGVRLPACASYNRQTPPASGASVSALEQPAAEQIEKISTVLRGPHVDKKSVGPVSKSARTRPCWISLIRAPDRDAADEAHLPAGVDVEIKLQS